MEIREMRSEDIANRVEEIAEEIKDENANVEELEEEVKALEERKAEIEREAETRAKEVEAVVEIAKEVETFEKEEVHKNMSEKEVRNSREYIDAFANYIKTNDDTEVRALLTTNVDGGTVPVPEFVYDIVKTAWEEEGIMALVNKTNLRGTLKVGFEISGDDAIVHTEGGEAITAENLTMGVVELKPVSIKKLVQISDEVYDNRGEEFLRYIYREIAHKIALKAADMLLKIITDNAGKTSTSVQAIGLITEQPSIGTIARALSQLSGEAQNPVIVMNRQTWADFKEVEYTGVSYPVDPFEGLKVLFNNSLPASSTAGENAYAIVGDFGYGTMANFPNGDDIDFKFDEMTQKDKDLIEVLGRQYVGLGVVAPKAFVAIKAQ